MDVDDFETRLMNMRDDVEELEIKLEKSESIFSEKVSFIKKLLEKDTTSKDIQELLVESHTEAYKANFEMLRDCLSIIKRCAPQAGDQLENLVNSYEKADEHLNNFLANLEKSPTISESEQTEEHKQEFEKFMLELEEALDKYTNIRFMVETILTISYALLIDVLDRLEKRS